MESMQELVNFGILLHLKGGSNMKSLLDQSGTSCKEREGSIRNYPENRESKGTQRLPLWGRRKVCITDSHSTGLYWKSTTKELNRNSARQLINHLICGFNRFCCLLSTFFHLTCKILILPLSWMLLFPLPWEMRTEKICYSLHLTKIVALFLLFSEYLVCVLIL